MKKDVNVSLVQGGKLTRGGWLTIVSFLLVAVLALSVSLGLVVKSGKETEREAEEAGIGGGMVLPEAQEENGISLVSEEIPHEEFALNDSIVPTAESAYEVTATAKDAQSSPLSEDQQKFKWTMKWNGSGTGNVTEYVTMSQDGGKTATFSCLQGFSTQIIVTCAWLYDETKSSTVVLDYAKRFLGFNIQFAIQGEFDNLCAPVLFPPMTDEEYFSQELTHICVTLPNASNWEVLDRTIFQVTGAKFGDVGTVENSVVSVSSNEDGGITSPMSGIIEQMDFIWNGIVFDDVFDEIDPDLYRAKRTGDVKFPVENVMLPRDSASMKERQFLASGFYYDYEVVLNLFGRGTGPHGAEPLDSQKTIEFVLKISNLFLSNKYDPLLGSFQIYFPTTVNLEHGTVHYQWPFETAIVYQYF